MGETSLYNACAGLPDPRLRNLDELVCALEPVLRQVMGSQAAGLRLVVDYIFQCKLSISLEMDGLMVSMRKVGDQLKVELPSTTYALTFMQRLLEEDFNRGDKDDAVASSCSVGLINLMPSIIR